MRNALTRALKDTVPIMTGYIVLGLGFGILLSAKGYNALWAFAMGTVIYSGTMQFAAIDLFSSGITPAASALVALMISARHLFYGISMVERYGKFHGLKKIYVIYALTDETYSLVCESDDEDYCFWVSLLDQIYWVSGSVAGALLGQILPFDSRGIDFALTALFVTICVEQWLTSDNYISALTGFIASVFCLVLFGAENFLIPSMIIITIALFIFRRKIENA